MVLKIKPFVAGPIPNPAFDNPSGSNPTISLLLKSISEIKDWDGAASSINTS